VEFEPNDIGLDDVDLVSKCSIASKWSCPASDKVFVAFLLSACLLAKVSWTQALCKPRYVLLFSLRILLTFSTSCCFRFLNLASLWSGKRVIKKSTVWLEKVAEAYCEFRNDLLIGTPIAGDDRE
jgi:hypothetical protein